jgi:hypothetical protein
VSGLDPQVAVDYLDELSTDIREAVVLSAAGEHLAGSSVLAKPARELLAAADAAAADASFADGRPAQLEVATPAGTVYGARSDEHAVFVVAGRQALSSVMLYDLGAVLADMAAAPPDGS